MSSSSRGVVYSLIDDGWESMSSGRINSIVSHANSKGVKLWFWKRWSEMDSQSERDAFFAKVKALGAVGLKIDFMDSECKQRVDFYETTLREAAKAGLMVNFHGAYKPNGESRTFPNEMTREGVRGAEHPSTSLEHRMILPFTRGLVGNMDYTPGYLNTSTASWGWNVASTINYTSPVQHWAEDPNRYLENPAVDVIKSIPAVWDETRVLSNSDIGKLIAFARRSGNTWFLGIMNDDTPDTITINLAEFLPEGEYNAILLRDDLSKRDNFIREVLRLSGDDVLTIDLRGTGGFVGTFTPIAAVPEPAAIGFFAISALLALRRRSTGRNA